MKKKYAVIGIILAAALMASGCGEGESPSSQTSASSGKASSAASSSQGGASSASSGKASSAASSSESGSSSASSGQGSSSSSSAQSSSSAAAETAADGTPIITGDDFAVSDCIELGEYLGLKLTKESTEVTDDDLTRYFANYLSQETLTDPDAEAKMWDTVTIAYEGSVDGEVKDGMVSDSHSVMIGSGSLIDGFEDGMIGMKVGDTRELDLRFPEHYHSEELSGKACVFKVTMKSIARAPEITDEWVEENTYGEYASAEAYIDQARETIRAQKEQEASDKLKNDGWTAVLADSTFLAYPAAYLQEGEDYYENYVQYNADMYNVTREEYLKMYGVSISQYETDKKQYGINVARSKLLMYALAEAEGLSAESPEYQAQLDALALEYGVSADELVANFGESSVYETVMTRLVTEIIADHADLS